MKTTSRLLAYALRFMLLVSLLIPVVNAQAATTTRTVCSSGCDYTSIQSAIDGASGGDTIKVYPGNYDETASARTILSGTLLAQGPHQFGLFFPSNKPGLTVMGVDALGNPITDPASGDLPYLTTNATNNFGASGIWVEANDITIQGLEIGPNIPGDNKTIEVVADHFILRYSNFSVQYGGAVYIGDWFYDAGTGVSSIESFTIDNNIFDDGTLIAISNGAGHSGLVAGRQITNNVFAMAGANSPDATNWPAISFSGSGTDVPWFVYPVGGAIITGNDFSGSTQYIRSRGTVQDSDFDWSSYWKDNTFDNKVMVGLNLPSEPRGYTYLSGSYNMPNTKRIGALIQPEIGNAEAGDTVLVGAGTYTETGQIVIAKNLTITGEDKVTTIIKPAQDTGTSGDARGWFLVNSGITFNLSNVTLDGTGHLINIGINSHGSGTIDNNIIQNMSYNGSGPDYAGRGIALWDANMTVSNNTIQNYGRIGVYVGSGVTGAVIDGNIIIGKGAGDHLDYGVELGRGGVAEVMNNSISDNLGVASVDGSTSAGILVTTYFAPGTSANIHNNTFSNNTTAIVVGYDEFDTSAVTAYHNQFLGNTEGIFSTAPAVDAEENWWGTMSGPGGEGLGTGDTVSTFVDYSPWCIDSACTMFSSIVPVTTTITSAASQDGWILESGENSSVGGSINATSSVIRVGDTNNRKQYRGLLSFNTASLPDNAVILSASIKIKKSGISGMPFSGHGNFVLDIKNLFFGGGSGLAKHDFQTAASQSGIGTFGPAVSQWFTVDLNSSAFPFIGTTNITQFRIYFSLGDDNDSVADYLSIFSGNSASANAPVLIILYYVP